MADDPSRPHPVSTGDDPRTPVAQLGRGGVAVGAGTRRGGNALGRHHPERSRTTWVVLVLIVVVAAVIVTLVMAGSGGSGGAGGAAPAQAHKASSSSGDHTSTAAAPATAESAKGTPLDPSKFTTGSCMAFSPTKGDKHETVFLDAGHGGIDPGALGVTESGQQIHEALQTLPVELDAMALLRAQGYRVVVSRTRNSTVLKPGPGDVATGAFTLQGEHDDVASRDVCANMAKATILLAIYFDAGTSSTNAGSITGYDTDRPFSADNLKLANLLQADVLSHLNAHGWTIPNDGVVPDTTLGGPAYTTTAADYDHLLLLGPADPGWFTTPSQMPGALIEPLFITDPFEATIATSSVGREAIAQGMAEAAEQYLQGQTAATSASSGKDKTEAGSRQQATTTSGHAATRASGRARRASPS